jgi:hypothetical protein
VSVLFSFSVAVHSQDSDYGGPPCLSSPGPGRHDKARACEHPGQSSLPDLSAGSACGRNNRDVCFGRLPLPDCGQAGRAVDWIAVSRYEWDGGFLAALSAHHFRLRSVRQTHLRLPGRSALGASCRNVDQFLFSEEVLFAGSPGEGTAAITTRQCLVSVLHVSEPPRTRPRVCRPGSAYIEVGTPATRPFFLQILSGFWVTISSIYTKCNSHTWRIAAI